MKLRTGGIEYHNKTSAPWLSTEIFVTGCYKNCPGCFNQRLRNFDEGNLIPTDEVIDCMKKFVDYKRITFSGGEPFLQAETLAYIAKELRKEGFIIVCYSGYTAEELPYLFPHARDLLENIDVLVDGIFIKELLTPIDKEYKFVGSNNQRIINIQKSLDRGEIILWSDEDTIRIKEGTNGK